MSEANSRLVILSFFLSHALSLFHSLLHTHRYLAPLSPSRDERCCWFLRCCPCPALLSFFFFNAAFAVASGLGSERSALKSALVIGFAARGALADVPSPSPSPSPPLSDIGGRRKAKGRLEKERKKKREKSDGEPLATPSALALLCLFSASFSSLSSLSLSIHGNAAADQRAARARRHQARRFVVDAIEGEREKKKREQRDAIGGR